MESQVTLLPGNPSGDPSSPSRTLRDQELASGFSGFGILVFCEEVLTSWTGKGAHTLAALNLLAFLTHTLIDFTHETYQEVRQRLGSRQRFFNDIRALT
jgi:hypothetical protein